MADERARAQEGGLVALAFFFRKCHHFDAKRQALASAVQLAYAGHGHQDAQAAVVLSAVAHGVVMRSGHEVFCGGFFAVVTAHHVADGVDIHFVKAARCFHPKADSLSALAVSLGEVGDGELAFLGKTGVAVSGEFLMGIPREVSKLWHVVKLVAQANLGNAVDVAQCLGQFKLGVVVQPPGKSVDDLLLGQARAARPTHRQDEWEAKAFVVGRVELLDALKLFGCALRQARFVLLIGGFGREAIGHHGLARQFWVSANQGQLRIQLCRAHHLRQRVLQVRQAAKGPLRQGLLCYPGRVFVQPVQQRQRLGGAGGVELFQSQWHSGCFKKVSCWRLLHKR